MAVLRAGTRRVVACALGALVTLGGLAAPTLAVAWRWSHHRPGPDDLHYGEWDPLVAMLQTMLVFSVVVLVGVPLFAFSRKYSVLRAFGAGFVLATLVPVALLVWLMLYGGLVGAVVWG